MEQPINMDGFANVLDMLAAIQGIKGKGARLYRWYAKYKANAVRARRDGDIEYALRQEQICERIYAKIPNSLKW